MLTIHFFAWAIFSGAGRFYPAVPSGSGVFSMSWVWRAACPISNRWGGRSEDPFRGLRAGPERFSPSTSAAYLAPHPRAAPDLRRKSALVSDVRIRGTRNAEFSSFIIPSFRIRIFLSIRRRFTGRAHTVKCLLFSGSSL